MTLLFESAGFTEDQLRDHVAKQPADIFLFGLGHDLRCTYQLELIRESLRQFSAVAVLENAPSRADIETHVLHRQDAERILAGVSRVWNLQVSRISQAWLHNFATQMRSIVEGKDKATPIRILVDYSAMLKAAIGELLVFLRYFDWPGGIEIDFVYARGRYNGQLMSSRVVDIGLMPSFEGSFGAGLPCMLVLGLGYSSAGAYPVLDRLEPKRIVAVRTPYGVHSRAVKDAHSEILEFADAEVTCSVVEVSELVRLIFEVAGPYSVSHEIAFCPMGPKPHVLAFLLAAAMERRFAVLDVATGWRRYSEVEQTRPTRELVYTRVSRPGGPIQELKTPR